MRAVRVPVFVLAAVLAYILCNAAWVTGESQRWLDAAAQVSDAALQGSTADAGEAFGKGVVLFSRARMPPPYSTKPGDMTRREPASDHRSTNGRPLEGGP